MGTSRLGAALGFRRGLTISEVAAELGVHERTAARWVADDQALTAKQRDIVCALTGVPGWFLEHGFDPPAELREQAATDRLATLERQVALLMQREDAKAPPAPPGAAGRRPQAPRSNDASRKPSGKKRAEGST